jgi:hypothetical protein
VNQQNHPPELPGGGVPLEMTTIADKLSSTGYLCHQLGKSHLVNNCHVFFALFLGPFSLFFLFLVAIFFTFSC